MSTPRCQYLAVVLMMFISAPLFSQKTELINPAELFDNASVLSDSGRYGEAIALLKKIEERDTAYNAMKLRLVYAYYNNKQYDSAIIVCDQLLSMPSQTKPEYLRMRALAMSGNNGYEKAIVELEKAIKLYPTEVSLPLLLGALHYDNKKFDKASEQFFKVLEINPFHQVAHLNLARIAIGQGRKVNGMLAMGLYLSVRPSDNEKLVLLNEFVDNQVTDEGTYPAVGVSKSSRLDQMIRAKIVMESDFKSAFSVKAPVVQQYELLFDQLNTLVADNTDPYLKHYLPVYKAIKQNNHTEAFIYHLLTSSSIEPAKKWLSKNSKVLDEFFKSTNVAFSQSRKTLAFPDLGFPSKTNVLYDQSNRVSSIGQLVNEKNQGRWIYFHDNGEKSAEGNFNDQGVKTGVWNYFYRNGKPKSTENHDTGEVTGYSETGVKTEQFKLLNDKIEGEAKTYYTSGRLKQTLSFTAGERNGKALFYYADGKLNVTYSYKNGTINGPYESLHPNGRLELKTTYSDDYYDGKYERYYSNGKPEMIGDYVKGYPVGPWKYYHKSGAVAREGVYNAKGIPTGEWKYYDYRGDLTEKRNYDDQGRYHGTVIFYDEGKQFCVADYKKDLLTKNTYYGADGKVIFSAGSNNGTFHHKGFSIDGKLTQEGEYVAGKAEGLWKFYDRMGQVTNEYNYKKDQLDGKTISYYPSGEKMVESSYKEGEPDGHFVRYSKSGKIIQEGWYSAGKQEQRWVEYFPNGTLKSDEYFIDGDLTGKARYYAFDGKPYVDVVYKNGIGSERVYYDAKGNKSFVKGVEDFNEVHQLLYANKKVKTQFELTSGRFTNRRTTYYPDGSVFHEYQMLNNTEHGKYIYNEMDGKPSSVGQYEDGEKSGIWKSYHENGKLFSMGKYYRDERDSVWIFYNDDGKLSSTGSYKDGQKHGNFIYYSPEGQPVVEKVFRYDDQVRYRVLTGTTPGEWIEFNGTGKIVINYANGKPALEEERKNSLITGVRKEYYSTGGIYEENYYVNGDLDGENKLYYPNGKVKERRQFKGDEHNGVVELYAEDGQVLQRTEYREGYMHGKSAIYENKKKVKEYTFWYGTIEQ